jgi:hypothetical protein
MPVSTEVPAHFELYTDIAWDVLGDFALPDADIDVFVDGVYAALAQRQSELDALMADVRAIVAQSVQTVM